MPAKLITSEAKELFTKFVYSSANADVIWNLFISRSSKSQDSASRLAVQKKVLKELLANKSLWAGAVEIPRIINPISASSNSDWNGDKLANIKIRGKLFLFRNALFDVTGLHSEEEARLVVLKKHQKERSEIDFLKSRSDESQAKSETGREHIPERIRNEVWRRDGAKCVECSSVYNLEFDHVIPVAKGGSNTARNLRILCEPCNRRKSARIG